MNVSSRCVNGRVIGLVVLSAVMGCATVARAANSFYESFDTRPGNYTVGDLTPQNPPVAGFTTAWTDGTTATSAWNVDAAGLNSSVDGGEFGGSLSFNGSAGLQRAYRSFTASTHSVYYFSSLLRLDSASSMTGTNVIGVTSNQSGVSDSNFFDPVGAANIEGLIWGFEGDGSQINLVLRTRKDIDPSATQTVRMSSETLLSNVTVGQTYQVVFKLERDVFSPAASQGNDRVSAWINPTNIANEALAGTPDFVSSDFAINTSLSQLVVASNGFTNTSHFDEIRLGTGWSDAAVVSRRIAADNFQTGPDTNVNTHTVNGGTGWGGAWVNDGNTGTFSVTTPATPLSAANVVGGGRAMTATGFTVDSNPRSISRALASPEVGDVFVHFLVRFDGSFDPNDLFDFQLLSGTTDVARFGAKDGGGAGGDFFASVAGGGTSFYGGDLLAGEDHLIVLRLSKNFGASIYNTLSVWIDPTFDDYANPLINVTGSSLSITSIDGVHFGQQNLEPTDHVYFDNLVLGTSWNQVVPTPEPTSLVIFAVGGLALMRRRARSV